ncbi:hypothetical protein AADG42_02730 [Ammonicoccus fulvus]|uniref:Uncharacterized protein n=1 Tax=Ammonicoccus fulvus TaxID=3138240 RepID=A0ABZ3FMD6_9ACTN
MTNPKDFELVPGQRGAWTVNTVAGDDPVSFMLLMGGAGEASKGKLDEDEASARAVVAYLLGRQQADDLPNRVEIGDVTASYGDVVDEIVRLRDGDAESVGESS